MSKYVVPDRVFITPADMRKRYGDFDPNVFTRWQREGKVVKLRNGLYMDSHFKPMREVDRFTIANHLYSPSYVSLYSALNYHGIIPEYAVDITSVTTRKTQCYSHGRFRYYYRNMKPEFFFAYEDVSIDGQTYSIASPEKALLDLAYFEPLFSDADWLLGMRFDRFAITEELDWEKMFLYGHQLNSKSVDSRIGHLLDVYDIS